MAGFGFMICDLYDLTVAELIMMLKGCREQQSYQMWKSAYLIARAVLDKDYPQSHQEANPELVERKTIRVDDWVIKGATNNVR